MTYKRVEYRILMDRYGSLWVNDISYETPELAEKATANIKDVSTPYAIVKTEHKIVKHLTKSSEGADLWVKGMSPPGYFSRSDQSKK